MDHSLLLAFLLTLLAGLSTGIGSVIAFVTRHTNRRFLSGSLGFSAGVMLYVSFCPKREPPSKRTWEGAAAAGPPSAVSSAACFSSPSLTGASLPRRIPTKPNRWRQKPPSPPLPFFAWEG